MTHLPNIFYLSNLHSSSGVLVLTPKNGRLLVDFRYQEAVANLIGAKGFPPDIQVVEVPGSYEESLSSVISHAGWSRVGVEAEHMSLRFWQWLRKSITAEIVETEGLVENLRILKDAHEIALFREAGERIVSALALIRQQGFSSRSEVEISHEIERRLFEVGFDGTAFSTIVASGLNSALPHAQPTSRKVTDGDLVVLDFGGNYHGYSVDLTRTVAVGRLSSEQKRLHEAVCLAQEAALKTIHPGILASSVDKAARDVLRDFGLADAFGHSTGHGLGIEVHELPRVGRKRIQGGPTEGDITLEPGMVFTVEPGVYVPGIGGVRVEDDVLVTHDGFEMLTEAPRGLSVTK